MTQNDFPYAPWGKLQELVGKSSRKLSYHRHPSRAVLCAYLQQALPQRPRNWSEERAEKLNRGRLTDWTMWEVAAHISNCSRCRSRIKALENAQGKQTAMNWLRILKDTLRKPRLAPVGWALAGVQAALLIGVLVWMNTTLPSQPITTVPVYIDTNNSSYNSTVLSADLIRIELRGEARIDEITTLMQTLQLQLVGPDSEGLYLIKKSDGIYLTQEDAQIIQEIQAHPLLLRITDKAELPGDQGG